MSDALTSERDLFATDDSSISSVITGQEEEGVETTQGGDFSHSQNLPEDVEGGSSQKLSEHVESEKSADKEESTEQSKRQKRKAAKQSKGAPKLKQHASKKAN
ncbi:hypothetical protein EMPG_10533 [Blastomyces silverae]|uniref:Uncharacterized protein n=1 Tax=Blastomyces silverae TaxID=2060906 RepID=A0A0H1B9X3_9EURO|nr:hypothetical protein EMPG_10533 [Blastomyces silverae]